MKKRQAVSVNKKKTKTSKIKGQSYGAKKAARVKRAAPANPLILIPVKRVASTTKPTDTSSAHQRHPINDGRRHAPTTSQILMRSSVKKPDLSLKRRLKISESTDSLMGNTSIIESSPRVSLAIEHHDRSQRAASFQQSERISHFAVLTEKQATKVASPTVQAVQQPPQTTPPVIPKSPTDILLERAFSQATAHEQAPPAHRKSKWRRVSIIGVPVAVLALLVIGARNFTTVQLRVASAKAGFNTSLPAYHPAGYSLGQLSYNSGIFAGQFQTKDGSQSYTITEKSTSWNTQELLDGYVSSSTVNYQAVRIGSRTIYLYGSGNATWINNGVWYQLNSDGSLNESQIINVVNSL